MSRIARLKEEVTITDLLAHLGADVSGLPPDWGQWSPMRCPFHNDSSPSASVNRQLGKFNCHGCDVHGDIIDLAKEELGIADTNEAIEWLERELG